MVQLEFPLFVSGGGVERSDCTKGLIDGQFVFAASAEKGAGLEFSVTFEIDAANFARGNVEKFGKRAVGRTEPDGGAIEIGKHENTGVGGIGSGNYVGAAFGVESLGPGLFYIRLASNEFAGG